MHPVGLDNTLMIEYMNTCTHIFTRDTVSTPDRGSASSLLESGGSTRYGVRVRRA